MTNVFSDKIESDLSSSQLDIENNNERIEMVRKNHRSLDVYSHPIQLFKYCQAYHSKQSVIFDGKHLSSATPHLWIILAFL